MHTCRPSLPARRARRGLTLIEVLVALGIVIGLLAVAAPVLSSLFSLEQRRAARDLALTYELMHDEAVLKNATFRVVYHLDANYYEIEVGDAETLVFADPKARQAFEEARRSKMRRSTKRELAEAPADEPSFTAVAARFQTRVDLPSGTRFGGVYTPQYGELVVPANVQEGDDREVVVYSYLFADGFSEHTVVHLVSDTDPNEGYTIEVEPLSGRIHLHTEVVPLRELLRDQQVSAPSLPN